MGQEGGWTGPAQLAGSTVSTMGKSQLKIGGEKVSSNLEAKIYLMINTVRIMKNDMACKEEIKSLIRDVVQEETS